MMYETQLDRKTRLGKYIGNHHSFCFGHSPNTTQCKSLPYKHPGLLVLSKCGKMLKKLRTMLRLRPIWTCFTSFGVSDSIKACL